MIGNVAYEEVVGVVLGSLVAIVGEGILGFVWKEMGDVVLEGIVGVLFEEIAVVLEKLGDVVWVEIVGV